MLPTTTITPAYLLLAIVPLAALSGPAARGQTAVAVSPAQEAKAGGEQHTVSEASSIDVRVYGGGTVAVDIGDYTEAGRDKDGRPFERKSRFTNVWVLKDGAWRCVSGHASLIPATP